MYENCTVVVVLCKALEMIRQVTAKNLTLDNVGVLTVTMNLLGKH